MIVPFSVFISATCMSGDPSSGWAALGDEVLMATETAARHFGRKVDEFILEK